MLEDIEIRKVTEADAGAWLDLTKRLWPNSTPDELEWVLQNVLHSDREVGVIVRLRDGAPIACMNLSLRFDYVAGALQKPVIYLEGIYVVEACRKKGVARRLINYAEEWALSHGCSQLASDALLENVESQAFHNCVGFREVSRTVAFIKAVAQPRHQNK